MLVMLINIHFNPVKHGHAARVRDWPYSSFHRMAKLGVYPLDWGGRFDDDDAGFGERGDGFRFRRR